MMVSLVLTGLRAGHRWLKAVNDLFDAGERLIECGIAPPLVLIDIFEIDPDPGLRVGRSLGFLPVAQNKRVVFGFRADFPAGSAILFTRLHEAAPHS